MSLNYLLMEQDDMKRAGIGGKRQSMGVILVSQGYDITMIILIIIYSIMIAFYFVLEDIVFN